MAHHPYLKALERAVVGFGAGFVLACYGLVGFGVPRFAPWRDVSHPEIDETVRACWIALSVSINVAVVAVTAGRIRVSLYWFWLAVAFGVTGAIPFWPHKDGSLLPLATAYLNSGLPREPIGLLVLLAAHLVVACGLAALLQWGSSRMRQVERQDCGQPTPP